MRRYNDISDEEITNIVSFYESHSTKITASFFDISEYTLLRVLKRVGVDKHTKAQNSKFTSLEIYGVDNPSKNPHTIEKIKQTKLSIYGNSNYNNPTKIRQTCSVKYGKPSASGNNEVRERIKRTCQEKYGVDNPFQRRDLVEEGMIRKHGSVEAAIKYTSEKRKEHVTTKYGVVNISQIPETREKAIESTRETCIKKYGVEYCTLLPQCQFSKGRSSLSAPNQQFSQLLVDNGISFEREYTIGRYSYDFKVENILIEINPSATHNSTWSPFGDNNTKSSTYHKNKSLFANERGFRCIHVWDWDDRYKIINLLKRQDKIYARKCELREITKEATKEFLNSYHLQGYLSSDIAVGLFYRDNLVSLMTFGKPRYNRSYQYELLRYCNRMCVIGGAEKLFSYFVNRYKPASIVSYCDMSKFTGSVYSKLNMNLESIQVSKHWYSLKTKQHILDTSLNKVGFDNLFHTNYGKGTSNKELMKQHGFVEIYDAGQATYTISFDKGL